VTKIAIYGCLHYLGLLDESGSWLVPSSFLPSFLNVKQVQVAVKSLWRMLSLELFVRRSLDDTEHSIETQGVLKTTLYKNNSNNNWRLCNLAF